MDDLARRVLKVEYEAETASFRYPHFLIGRQPTFRLPPLSAVYGHLASALGGPFDPKAVRLAYAFRHAGVYVDTETSHKTTVATSNSSKKYGFIANVEIQTEPLERELLFRPRMTLYVDSEQNLRDSLAEACKAPRYPVLLGRSQDLGWYSRVEEIRLERRSGGFFDHTILPHSYSGSTRAGIVVLMPRFLDPVSRKASWGQYVQFEARGPAVSQDDRAHPECVVVGSTPFDVDPSVTDPKIPGGRIIVWHDLIGA